MPWFPRLQSGNNWVRTFIQGAHVERGLVESMAGQLLRTNLRPAGAPRRWVACERCDHIRAGRASESWRLFSPVLGGVMG